MQFEVKSHKMVITPGGHLSCVNSGATLVITAATRFLHNSAFSIFFYYYLKIFLFHCQLNPTHKTVTLDPAV